MWRLIFWQEMRTDMVFDTCFCFRQKIWLYFVNKNNSSILFSILFVQREFLLNCVSSIFLENYWEIFWALAFRNWCKNRDQWSSADPQLWTIFQWIKVTLLSDSNLPRPLPASSFLHPNRCSKPSSATLQVKVGILPRENEIKIGWYLQWIMNLNNFRKKTRFMKDPVYLHASIIQHGEKKR